MPEVQRPAMSEYGVPADPTGALPFEWARERLAANRNYWVVTVDPAGRPHSTPVWGLWHTDDAFWFSCAPSSLKARNLRANPHVAVTTDDTVEFVSVEGVAAELAPPPEGGPRSTTRPATRRRWSSRWSSSSRTLHSGSARARRSA